MVDDINLSEEEIRHDAAIVTGRVKKKVFISFVSLLTDPVSKRGEEGPVLTLCREILPDAVYLFPSFDPNSDTGSTEGNAHAVRDTLLNIIPEASCGIKLMELSDPTDFDMLSKEWLGKLNEMINELGDPTSYEFHLNCSSGTSQMQATAHLFANSGKIPGIICWQCRSPKDAKNGPLNCKIGTSLFKDYASAEHMKSSVNNMDFISAEDTLKQMLSGISAERDPVHHSIVSLALSVFHAYACMDMLRYQAAYSVLRDADRKFGQKAGLGSRHRDLLNNQLKFLEKLKSGGIGETEDNLIDLYFNIIRCKRRGAYADVLARFRRLVEGCLYYRLSEKHGIDPRNLSRSPDKNKLKMLKDNPQLKPSWNFIGLANAREALKLMNDDKVRESEDLLNEAIDYTDSRNHTIVAHGMSEVKEDDAHKSVECAYGLLKMLVLGCRYKLINAYPFKEDDIRLWTKLF